MHFRAAVIVIMLGGSLLGGCVSSGTYNAKVAELEQMRVQVKQLNGALTDMTKQRNDQQYEVSETRTKVADLEIRLGEAQGRLSAAAEEHDKAQRASEASQPPHRRRIH